MAIEIRRETADVLSAYAAIPIAFEVREVIDVAALDPARSPLPVRAVTPRIKDYDALPDNHPTGWLNRRGIAEWIFLVAYDSGVGVAGAVVVTEHGAIAELGGRSDHGLLWDLRVLPRRRRGGIGRMLLTRVEEVARAESVRALDVETQDTNAPACRLYAACGFSLTEIHPHAYGDLDDETKLLWTKRL